MNTSCAAIMSAVGKARQNIRPVASRVGHRGVGGSRARNVPQVKPGAPQSAVETAAVRAFRGFRRVGRASGANVLSSRILPGPDWDMTGREPRKTLWAAADKLASFLSGKEASYDKFPRLF
jgi:hypothetical protein